MSDERKNYFEKAIEEAFMGLFSEQIAQKMREARKTPPIVISPTPGTPIFFAAGQSNPPEIIIAKPKQFKKPISWQSDSIQSAIFDAINKTEYSFEGDRVNDVDIYGTVQATARPVLRYGEWVLTSPIVQSVVIQP